jgi:hypothetical protein
LWWSIWGAYQQTFCGVVIGGYRAAIFNFNTNIREWVFRGVRWRTRAMNSWFTNEARSNRILNGIIEMFDKKLERLNPETNFRNLMDITRNVISSLLATELFLIFRKVVNSLIYKRLFKTV